MNKATETFVRGMFVVTFWVTIFFGFLFTPRIMRHISSDNSISICIWSGVIDPQLFKKFEKETGIHVNVNYFESNEELLVKLFATQGKGYDMISPSDYVVQFLHQHGLIQRLDKSKLNFFDDLNPKLLGHYFDPKNEYSVPAEWYITGIGINTDYFKDGLPEASWDLLFNPQKMPDHLGLLGDSREMIGLAIKYKYGESRPINQKEVQEIKEILVAQRQKAEAYTDFRGDFLLESGNCSAVVVGNYVVWKTVRDDPKIKFLIPKEGTFLNLENYVIPAVSKKEHQVYKLLNFLYRSEYHKHNFANEYASFMSSRKDADYMFDTPELKESLEYVRPDSTGQAWPYQNFLTDAQVNEIWLAVKGG